MVAILLIDAVSPSRQTGSVALLILCVLSYSAWIGCATRSTRNW